MGSCTFYDVTLGDNDVDCQTFDCYWPNASESTPTDPTVGVLSASARFVRATISVRQLRDLFRYRRLGFRDRYRFGKRR